MSKRVLGALAALAGIGAIGLAGTLAAQEKGDHSVARSYAVAFGGSGSYLGVSIGEVTAETVEELGLREERGVMIQSVGDDTPAARAGLMKNDVIVSWNGTDIEGTVQLRRFLDETPAGRTVTLGVFRDRSQQSIDVELGERNMFSSLHVNPEIAVRTRELGERIRRSVKVRPQMRGLSFLTSGGRMGASVQSLDGQLAEYFGLNDRGGVLVTSVGEDSPAAQAGLQAGDVILSVDGDDVEDPGDLIQAILEAEEGPVGIRVLRDKRERTLTVELPESEMRWKSEDGESHGFFFHEGDGEAPLYRSFGPDDRQDVEISVEPFEGHFEFFTPSSPHIFEFEDGEDAGHLAPGGQIRVRAPRAAPDSGAVPAPAARSAAPAVAL